jgi:hypothetical protein
VLSKKTESPAQNLSPLKSSKTLGYIESPIIKHEGQDKKKANFRSPTFQPDSFDRHMITSEESPSKFTLSRQLIRVNFVASPDHEEEDYRVDDEEEMHA